MGSESWMAAKPTQLSNFRQAGFTGTPRWSPDGRPHRLRFPRKSGKTALFTSLIRQPPSSKQISNQQYLLPPMPSWSPDGKWIYFTSESGGIGKDAGFLYRVRS